MQLVSSDEYQKQADSNRTRTVTTAAPRGRILDRNGVELVTNRPSPTVVAIKNTSARSGGGYRSGAITVRLLLILIT